MGGWERMSHWARAWRSTSVLGWTGAPSFRQCPTVLADRPNAYIFPCRFLPFQHFWGDGVRNLRIFCLKSHFFVESVETVAILLRSRTTSSRKP